MESINAQPVQSPGVFWAEMSPCEHVVQIYGDDDVFLDTLEGYIGAGLRAGESAIVIGSVLHLHGLDRRLRAQGIDLASARSEGRYIARLAEDTLGRFLVKGRIDPDRFRATIGELLDSARGPEGRKVRAFGEMVAILWARGFVAATVELEMLWTKLCEEERLALFCAYPRDGFTKNATESIVDICHLHSRVVSLPTRTVS